MRALWQNQTMHCGYFDTTRKGNHSIVFWHQQWLVGDAFQRATDGVRTFLVSHRVAQKAICWFF